MLGYLLKEGSRYTVDEVFYSYHDGRQHLRQHRQQNDGTHKWKQSVQDQCVYDMLNIFLRARSFDPTGWKKGNTIHFPIADGKNIDAAQIFYRPGRKGKPCVNGIGQQKEGRAVNCQKEDGQAEGIQQQRAFHMAIFR